MVCSFACAFLWECSIESGKKTGIFVGNFFVEEFSWFCECLLEWKNWNYVEFYCESLGKFWHICLKLSTLHISHPVFWFSITWGNPSSVITFIWGLCVNVSKCTYVEEHKKKHHISSVKVEQKTSKKVFTALEMSSHVPTKQHLRQRKCSRIQSFAEIKWTLKVSYSLSN